jgi:hypothetical protein
MTGFIKVSFRLLTVTLVVVVHEPTPAGAAEITCFDTWRGAAAHVSSIEGFMKRRWPSGARPSANSCSHALIKGTIEKGDYDRFRVFYKERYRFMSTVYLVSPGGDAYEAMKIGRLLRKYLSTVVAPFTSGNDAVLYHLSRDNPVCRGPSCTCASACALIWFGGVSRLGIVGVHRPRFTDPQFSALPPGEASTVYKQLSEISPTTSRKWKRRAH